MVFATIAGLAACQGPQSALDPAADDAARLATLSWVLFIGAAVIFAGVMALLLVAISLAPERRRWLGSRRTVVAGGLVFPIVTLTALFIYGLFLLRDTNAASDGALSIEVVGEQYWWRVRYPGEGRGAEFTTANEVQVPVGRPVTVSVTSADVIHAFWIPNFAGKIDMIPGRVNTLSFTAERPGIFRGVCTEFCGDQHARMAFDVVALEPAAFDAWRSAQAQPARRVSTPFWEEGATLFTRGGCGNCHTVRGTAAVGELGPDLTHVGSRRSIGAGTYPNNVGTLAGWIADTQHLKEGARMPSYGALTGEELRALAGYLESLK
ncbi:MAG: cytochrome c oxidase subunit II [Pseudomonadota bacterium]|nr:cytochrome c oxidase subunit II [Pseudomonadota bacterium]